jgi:ankyrin repeat protein
MHSDYPPLLLAASAGDLDTLRSLAPSAASLDLNQALAQAAALSQFEAADLLREHGADPKGLYDPDYGSVLFPACDFLNPDGIDYLLRHGADPCGIVKRLDGPRDALAHLLHSRQRSPLKPRCIQLLQQAGASVPDDAVLAIHRGSLSLLRAALDRDPDSLTQPLTTDYGHFPLRGATLLHLATEFNHADLAAELLARGLNINTLAVRIPATVRTQPVFPTRLVAMGGHSALFHAKGHAKDMLTFLLKRGADPSIPAPFLRKSKTIRLTPLQFFEEVDLIECNLLEEILTLRGA